MKALQTTTTTTVVLLYCKRIESFTQGQKKKKSNLPNKMGTLRPVFYSSTGREKTIPTPYPTRNKQHTTPSYGNETHAQQPKHIYINKLPNSKFHPTTRDNKKPQTSKHHTYQDSITSQANSHATPPPRPAPRALSPHPFLG